ncbi:hypothetical protein QR680_009832 [Steinernema hermaphroditum]|uniref:Major facilitator superfamily (MFS) profile domain-containing protein n=1 Tax=Steinernema hermaphroditum TaxID=289476 RepID=A0AA39MAM1_9BILA|nr:hypothetical protein QR680_009832 [Steinernema hermaphroditum]
MTVVAVDYDVTDIKNPKFAFANRTRYVILILATLCLSIILSNTLTLNFTIICMSPNRTAENVTELAVRDKRDVTPEEINALILARQKILLENQERQDQLLNEIQSMLRSQSPKETFMNVIAATNNLEEEIVAGSYDYTQSQKSQLFSIVAVGALVAVYPTIWLIQYFGPRKVVSAYGFVSALSTALIPLFASWGFWWLLFMRFIQGTALSVCLNVIGCVTAHWSMLKTNAFFIALLTCFFQFGPIFTMPISGILCESSLGWPSVYYLHAVITVILFVLFAYFYRDAPHQHRNVSERELGKIQRGKEDMPTREPVPYRAILTSNAIWAVWISALANFMGIQITMQYSPTYLNKVMGFPVEMTGLFSAIPQVFTFIMKVIAGILSDKLTCIRPVVSVKLFNTIALGGMGTFFFAMAYTPTTAPMLGLVLLSCCCTILGFNCGAFFKSSQLVARHHNHFIMGNNSFINCLATLLAPVIVNIFVKEDTFDEWWWVWMLHGVLLYVANIYFCIFGKGEPAEWTKVKPRPNQVAAA